jgi:hypothetical protein
MNFLTGLWRIAARFGSLVARAKFGVFAAFGTGLLCGAGWIVLEFAPELLHHRFGGLSFVPRWRMLWTAAVFAAGALWLVHTLARACTLVFARTNRRTLLLGISIAQLLVAAGAMISLWFEIGPPEERFVVSATPVDVHGEAYRALRIESVSRRRGYHRPVVAWLERTLKDSTDRIRVRRGHSWPTLSGKYRLTLVRAEVATLGAVVRHGHERVELTPNKAALAGSDAIVLHGVVNPGTESARATPKADISIGTHRTLLPLDPEWQGETALVSLKEAPVLVLRARKNIGVSLAAVSIGSLVASLVVALIHTRLAKRARA